VAEDFATSHPYLPTEAGEVARVIAFEPVNQEILSWMVLMLDKLAVMKGRDGRHEIKIVG
jgi:hypothetical protein